MTIYVTITKEDGFNRAIYAFVTEESAKQNEVAWLQSVRIKNVADRERASDWGTSFAIWEVQLKP